LNRDVRRSIDLVIRIDPVSTWGNVGAPEGIRTPNLLIRSQMLYPLSYGRVVANDRPSV
jgi:hypothetical protein